MYGNKYRRKTCLLVEYDDINLHYPMWTTVGLFVLFELGKRVSKRRFASAHAARDAARTRRQHAKALSVVSPIHHTADDALIDAREKEEEEAEDELIDGRART